MRRSTWLPFLCASASLVLTASCASTDDDDDAGEVSAVLESGETATLAQALISAPAGAASVAAIAEHVARHAMGALYPASCATRTLADGHAHLEMTDCTGPFGKRKVTGGIDFDFALAPSLASGAVVVDIHGSLGLTANGAPLTYDATASWVPGGANVHWEAHGIGTSAKGRAYDKFSTLDLAVDVASPLCTTLAGNVHGTVDGRGVDVAVSSYRVCGASCPASGEIVKTKDKKNVAKGTKVKHIVFDGSDQAVVTDPKGRTRSVALVCGEDAE